MTERVWIVEYRYGQYADETSGFYTPVHRTKQGAELHMEKAAASMRLARDARNPDRFRGEWEYLDRELWVSSADVAP